MLPKMGVFSPPGNLEAEITVTMITFKKQPMQMREVASL